MKSLQLVIPGLCSRRGMLSVTSCEKIAVYPGLEMFESFYIQLSRYILNKTSKCYPTKYLKVTLDWKATSSSNVMKQAIVTSREGVSI